MSFSPFPAEAKQPNRGESKMFRIISVTIITLITLTALIGCGQRVPRRVEVMYNPSLNSVAVTELGDTMIEKRYGHVATRSFASLSDKSNVEKYNLHDNSLYKNVNNGNNFKFSPWRKWECVLHARRDSLIDQNCDGKFDLNASGEKLAEPVPYTVEKKDVMVNISRDSYKKEIIYQGKIDNKVNMLYREFYALDNKFMIREAYTQNIEYELDNNGKALIGFKGLRMEILESTNNSIKYRIIKGFD